MNILITGAWQEAEKSINTIENMGHKVVFLQYEKDKYVVFDPFSDESVDIYQRMSKK